jgi:hypothetical protein
VKIPKYNNTLRYNILNVEGQLVNLYKCYFVTFGNYIPNDNGLFSQKNQITIFYPNVVPRFGNFGGIW